MPAYIRPLFCRGNGPFRWAALSGDPADIAVTDAALLEAFPDNEMVTRWLKMAAEKVHFQGLPCRICWLEYGERAKAGLIFNDLVRTGKVKAPIVIGRDHLDSGSVASPYRETESMTDGSDAIADWPILNALLNTAAGASWVSFHHGGGVGIGKSLHAGMVVVADGTDMMAERLQRVLTSDPGTGVMRHADAGYPEAIEKADEAASTCRWWSACPRSMSGRGPVGRRADRPGSRPLQGLRHLHRAVPARRSSTATSWAFPVVARPEDCTLCLLCELHCPDFAIEVQRRAKKRRPRAAASRRARRTRLAAACSRTADAAITAERRTDMAAGAPSCCRATRRSPRAPSPPARASSPATPSRRPPRSPRCSSRRLPEVGGSLHPDGGRDRLHRRRLRRLTGRAEGAHRHLRPRLQPDAGDDRLRRHGADPLRDRRRDARRAVHRACPRSPARAT